MREPGTDIRTFSPSFLRMLITTCTVDERVPLTDEQRTLLLLRVQRKNTRGLYDWNPHEEPDVVPWEALQQAFDGWNTRHRLTLTPEEHGQVAKK